MTNRQTINRDANNCNNDPRNFIRLKRPNSYSSDYCKHTPIASVTSWYYTQCCEPDSDILMPAATGNNILDNTKIQTKAKKIKSPRKTMILISENPSDRTFNGQKNAGNSKNGDSDDNDNCNNTGTTTKTNYDSKVWGSVCVCVCVCTSS